ncbi:MAG TPA: G8 domain-containing protein [Gemmataceae bacterium]|nr:G8 domain-containing protein [Gemmataceae bacterium]
MKALAGIVLGFLWVAVGSLDGAEPKAANQNAKPRLIRSVQSGPWSSPDTWEDKKVPDTGARVQVRAGHTVTYDVSSDRIIRSIHIAGTLTFARDRDTRLDVGLIKIQAGDDASENGFDCDAHLKKPDPSTDRPALEVGTANDPIPAGHTALIRLAAVEGLDKETCPAIVCCGGRMDLHGAPLSRTWVKLGTTVNASRANKGVALGPGDRVIKLAEAVTGWRVGDRIIVTTTTSRSRVNQRQTLRPGPGIAPAYTEERTIKTLDGDRITVDRPLVYAHLGQGDYRGEVANLSRNVIIESADPAKSRGHTMYHKHSAGAISYAEFRHLGKEGLLGKYPIHVHLAGDTMRGSYVLGASIWDSGNRWVTVHGTSYFIVRDCVGYQSVGHGYFLEDGSEVFNVFDRNLAVQAFAGKPLPDQFLPFDHNDGAGFWWANSQNTFSRNVAVECDRYGFRFEATPTKGFDLRRPVLQPDGSIEPVDIRTLSFIRFEDNEAHDHLFGINLGGRGGDFFAAGLGDVVPDQGSPFILQKTRIWNTHWAFAPFTRYAVDRLDIADSTYGLFLSAYDMEARSPRGADRREANPDWGSVTFRRTQVPVRLPDTKPGYFGKPFDLMAFEGDMQPPATVITHVGRDKSGVLVIRGTTTDNEIVAKVLVNGRAAKAIASNFAQWQVTLDDSAGGDIKLAAHAIDESGNVEPRPHILRVRVPKNRAISSGGAS